MIPLILNPGIRQRSVIGQSLYTRKKSPVPMKYKAVWALELVSTCWRQDTCLAKIRPACSLGTIVVTLFILLFLV